MKNNILYILVVVFSFLACSNPQKHATLPYYNTPDFTPHWKTDKSFPKELHSIAAFAFYDQNGKIFSENDLKGHITLANFFFTTCGSVCPKMTHNLLGIQDSLKLHRTAQILSFSVMPWKDSIATLKTYEVDNELDAKLWHLLTGNKSTIYTLARQSFFAEEEAGFALDSNEFLHTEHILLIDKNLHIRGIYNGTVKLDMQHILDDIRILEGE